MRATNAIIINVIEMHEYCHIFREEFEEIQRFVANYSNSKSNYLEVYLQWLFSIYDANNNYIENVANFK